MISQKYKVFAAIFIAIISILFLLLYRTVPLGGLQTLKTGFVKTEVDVMGLLERKITKKKPNDWVRLGKISKKARQAIVISEDWSFYDHPGLDFSQIRIAISESLFEGRRLRGASTISQQVVKNVFLTMDKSLGRKMEEALITLFMEGLFSKDKILEVYLNIAQFGPGIFGVKQASQHYFQKLPINLSAKEGAFLAMLLPSPVRYSESFRQREVTEFARNVIHTILKKMVVAKYLKLEEFHSEIESQFSFEIPAQDPEIIDNPLNFEEDYTQ